MAASRHKSKILFLCFLALLATGSLAAQTPRKTTDAKAASRLSVADVIKLSKAGLSDDLIAQEIRKNGQAFDLSPDQLIQLKSASVSDRVIQTMLDPSKADPPPPSPPPSATIPARATSDPLLPTDIGVYTKRKGEWTEVLPEVVNWKTGGVMKSIASAGIVKGDVNGHLLGPHSRNSVTTPLEFLIVVPEGTAITEYQLLRLRRNGDNREFRTVTGGVFHVSGGATRDLIPFEGKRIVGRQYSVVLPANLGAGEYGFLPPGAISSANAASSQGKLYSFQLLE